MYVQLNFQLGFLSSGGLHCWLINEPHGLSFNKVGWLGLGLLQGTHCIVSTGSPLSGLRIKCRFFFIPYSLRNMLLKFQNFSQSIGLVRNQFNRSRQAAPFNKHVALFWMFLPHSGSELSTIFFYSLFFVKSVVKVLEFFSINWTSWEPVQQAPTRQPCLINTSHCFGRFSLIRARN